MGRPLWVDDPSFNIDYHVRYTALPKPGSHRAAAKLLTGRIFSQRLDRTKPLWEIWLIEGLDGRPLRADQQDPPRAGRRRLGRRHHHRPVRPRPRPRRGARSPSASGRPAPSPPTPTSSPSGVKDLVKAPLRPRRARGSQGASNPVGTAGELRETAEGAGEVLWGTVSTRARVPAQRARSAPTAACSGSTADLGELKEIKDALGGTVNDVFLAVVSGALATLDAGAAGSAPRASSCAARSRSRSAPRTSRARPATRSRSWSAACRPTRTTRSSACASSAS